MKKIIFNCFFLVVICAGVLGLQNKIMSVPSSLSDVMLENVEALTQFEVELPEVVILCDTKGWGRCYVQMGLAMNGEYMYYPCRFDGSKYAYCSEPRYHG